MTALELARNRFALVLLFTIPALFFTLVWLTTGDDPVAFRLASVADDAVVEVSARRQSIVFIGISAVGLLSAFLAMSLMQKNADANRRLIVCGYRSAELIISKLLVMVLFVALISLYVALLQALFFRPLRFGYVVLGLGAAGFVHACYGLVVGALVRREMEGMLLVVLLVNIDAGWLQNPVFYAEAHNKALIRYLPAYFPSQATIVSAFTDHALTAALLGSVVYGLCLLLIGILIYFWRVRIRGWSAS